MAGKSPRTTALLAALLGIIGILGIGHLYLGRTKRGLAFLIGGIMGIVLLIAAMFVAILPFAGMDPSDTGTVPPGFLDAMIGWGVASAVFPLAYLGVWVWQIIDAYRIAKDMEQQRAI